MPKLSQAYVAKKMDFFIGPSGQLRLLSTVESLFPLAVDNGSDGFYTVP